MTGYVRLADVQSTIFESPTISDCFARERTVTKSGALSELRAKPGPATLQTKLQFNDIREWLLAVLGY